jgi:hypothetical protein
MKSDVVKITNSGEGFNEALCAADAAALYRGIGKKETLHLRLLAEEMMGMIRQITGETEAEFWVSSEGESFELHLVAYPVMTQAMRKELLKASSSGKNAAAKGFMGKIKDIFNRALASDDMRNLAYYYSQGIIMPENVYMTDSASYVSTTGTVSWSMNKYKTEVEKESANNAEAKDEWDELEKSIVASIADEVEIAISGDKVEMTVYKKF